ncbi:GDSL esterase/lipase At5g41890 [Sesamum indicum]|uniref:GDSL esterase/lipase At5g41890 n=1 Tax=Sesamum indicum TaxID=4182 RepID=A0A6I9TA37_SESIN|nr:GDSL esterase/lipase At5g41890 [Sesamum indicum]
MLPSTFSLLILFLHFQLSPCFCFTSFLFGDSLVDAGNNNYLFTLSKADSPPYGIDFAPSGGRPTGRFTNGRTIADIVGEGVGAKSFLQPYLGPNAAADAFDIGINYASGASGILDATGTLFIGRVPLNEQVSNFARTREYMVSVVGENRTTNLLKDAIFSVAIGSNDVINYFQQSIPFLGGSVSPSVFQDFMLSNFTMQLKRLHALGARKLVVVGLGPLGCIPFIRAINLVPSGQCSAAVNAFATAYNLKLKHELHQMNLHLGPSAIFLYANSYHIFTEIITNHRDYGFENSEGPCCGGYVPPFLCYKGKDATTTSALCDDRKAYVFWDAYHPTEAANLIVAERLLDGDTSYCSPMNIRQLYHHDFT